MTAPAEPGRRERKRTKTLDHLASTAFRLFEANGYDAVTMEQIAAAADVAKGTLYNHFPVKEALLAHWIHAELALHVEQLVEEIGRMEGFARQMQLVLDASTKWCEMHRNYLPHYLRFRFVALDAGAIDSRDLGHSDIIHAFEAAIAKGMQAGELRDDLPVAHLASLFQYLHLAVLMRWLTLPGLRLEDEYAATVDLFLNGARRVAGQG